MHTPFQAYIPQLAAAGVTTVRLTHTGTAVYDADGGLVFSIRWTVGTHIPPELLAWNFLNYEWMASLGFAVTVDYEDDEICILSVAPGALA